MRITLLDMKTATWSGRTAPEWPFPTTDMTRRLKNCSRLPIFSTSLQYAIQSGRQRQFLVSTKIQEGSEMQPFSERCMGIVKRVKLPSTSVQYPGCPIGAEAPF